MLEWHYTKRIGSVLYYLGPLLLALFSARISKYTLYKVWDEITYLFPNFNGCTFDVWELASNFIPRFTGHVITYPCGD